MTHPTWMTCKTCAYGYLLSPGDRVDDIDPADYERIICARGTQKLHLAKVDDCCEYHSMLEDLDPDVLPRCMESAD